jgi:hypothetical protein
MLGGPVSWGLLVELLVIALQHLPPFKAAPERPVQSIIVQVSGVVLLGAAEVLQFLAIQVKLVLVEAVAPALAAAARVMVTLPPQLEVGGAFSAAVGRAGLTAQVAATAVQAVLAAAAAVSVTPT